MRTNAPVMRSGRDNILTKQIKTSDPAAFLRGDGETAALMRGFDWGKTSLGPVARWPQSLKTATALLMQSPVPMVMLWGEDGVMIYNDAYSVFAGARHPKLFGSKVREGWREVADFNDNVMKVGLAGRTLAYKDQELTLYRSGKPEQVWMNLDYSPVLDERGEPAGVIAIVIETTERVLADRRAAAEQERQRQMLRQMPGFVAMLSGPDHVYDYVNDAYVKISQRSDFIGRPIREVFPDLAGQGFYELLDQVFTTGERVVLKGMEIRMHGSAAAQYIDFLYEPIRDATGAVSGIFVGGYEVTEAHRATQALRDSEARLRFLDALNIETAKSLDADAILATTTRMLGEHLGVSICAYADMDDDQDGFTIRGDWAAPGSASIVGHYSLAAFGTLAVKNLTAGLPLIINDNLAELEANEASAFQSIGIGATICMPLVKKGRLTSLMAIHQRQARTWTANDIALLREVTERSWAHIERVVAEAELRTSEDNFRTLARAMPNHAWTASPDGQLDWFNEQVYAYSGAAPGSLDGAGWTSLVHPDDLEGAGARWAQAVQGGETYEVEFRLCRADGAYRWHIARAVPIKNEAGVLLRWIGTNTDIHDQKESAAQLAALNADLERQVLERSHVGGRTWQLSTDMLGVANNDGFFESSNPAWQNVLGWSAEEIACTPLFDLIHPDDLRSTVAAFDQLQRGEPVLKYENRYRTKDGEYRWLTWVAVPESGKFYCSARDITADKAAEAEREQLWTLSQDMLARADYAGNILAVNPAWSTVLGYSEQELLSNPYANIIDPAYIDTVVAALNEMSVTGQPTRFENRILASNGEWKPIGWTVSPEPDGKHFIAIGRDLTEDKIREQKLLQTQEALRQAQKMEAIGQLTGGIAHDFNNLLAAITASVSLLERRMADGKPGAERYINAARDAAHRAAALTQRLLAFSRRQTLDPVPTDANRLVAGMEDLIRRTVGPSIDVEVVGAGGLWATRVDRPQLENSLLNLCINARDAMGPKGGRITIETANKWLDPRAAKERDLEPGQYISLCVTDTGEGMTPEVIARCFDPFFTTKPLGQGTGLGLSMVYGFVRQSGGQVRIYSEVGKGTTMCLYLPRHLGAVEEMEEPPAGPEIDSGDGETILVIDDEATLRMLIVDVLEENGYKTAAAADGPSGLKLLEANTRIDLLITDVGLPGGMNGRQVADAARAFRPNLKVLFITGYAENAAVGNGTLEPGMELLTKPFEISVLGSKVRDMLERD